MAGCFLWSFLFASPKSDLCSECSFEDVLTCVASEVIFPTLILLWSTVLYYFRSFGTCSGEVLKNAGCALLMAFFYAAVLLFKVLCSMILAGPAGRELLSNGLMFVMAVCVWCDLGKLCRCTRTANNTPASIKEDIVDDLY